MLKQIIKNFKLLTKGVEDGWQYVATAFGFGGQMGIQELQSLFVGWSYICISAIAEDVSVIELKAFKQTSKGLEEIEHPAIDLIYSFQPGMTKAQGIELLIMHKKIWGKAIWHVDVKRNRINPLMPNRLKTIADDDGMLRYYEYEKVTLSGGRRTVRYEINEIIVFRTIDPFNMQNCLSPMEKVYDWLVTELSATVYNKNFFKNDATPRLAIKSALATNQAAAQRLKESYYNDHRGVDNAHKLAVLPQGVTIEKIADSIKDMDFTNLDVRYQDKILSAFKVPKPRVAITNDVNRANAEATHYVYMKNNVDVEMRKFVEDLNEMYLPLFANTENVIIDYVSVVPEDEEAKIRKIESGLKGQPYMTINEVREKQGLEPVEGGDELMTTLQFFPLSTSTFSAGDETKAIVVKNAPVQGKHNVDIKAMLAKNRAGRARYSEAAKNIASAISKALLQKQSKYLSTELDEQLHKNFIVRGDNRIKLIEDRVKTVNGKIRKAVRKDLEEIVNQLKHFESDLKDLVVKQLDKDEIKGVIIAGLQGPLEEMFKSEAQEVLFNMGLVGEYVLTSRAEKQITKFTNKLGSSYSKKMVNDIKEVIRAGLKEGESIKQIAKRLDDTVFEAANRVSASRIAQTEVYRFSNLGLREGYEEIGIVATLRWYTAEDEKVCPWCGPLNGKTVDISEPFFGKGDKVIGQDGSVLSLDYAEVLGGPLHPNCRCYVRPDKISVI